RDFHVTGVQTCALPIYLHLQPIEYKGLSDLASCMHRVLCEPTEWSHPMKKSFLIPAACGLALRAQTQAESFDTAIGTIETSMNVTRATADIWRGQSQTDCADAIQSGLYIGTWASNVDSEDFGGSSVEVDYYVGFGNAITDDLSYDLQWATYTYPKNSDATVEELLASLSYKALTVGAKYAYDPGVGL